MSIPINKILLGDNYTDVRPEGSPAKRRPAVGPANRKRYVSPWGAPGEPYVSPCMHPCSTAPVSCPFCFVQCTPPLCPAALLLRHVPCSTHIIHIAAADLSDEARLGSQLCLYLSGTDHNFVLPMAKSAEQPIVARGREDEIGGGAGIQAEPGPV